MEAVFVKVGVTPGARAVSVGVGGVGTLGLASAAGGAVNLLVQPAIPNRVPPTSRRALRPRSESPCWIRFRKDMVGFLAVGMVLAGVFPPA
jgi:hypothetical protein